MTLPNPGKNNETELGDVSALLDRLPIAVDESMLKDAIAGRTVLVTGAGGTIGGELVRQLLSLGVARLVLLDHSEHALFWIDHELREIAPEDVAIESVLGSICDRAIVNKILASHRPDIVFHAAACKHVAMVESNEVAGIRTNVLGTQVLLESCRAGGVDRFLLVSSDKAANPSSLMGATKHCAEMLTSIAASDGRKYASVRFGNVLRSSGSVIPIFERQIARGEPLEIRHRDAFRYFMSKEEAGRLLLLVSTMMMGGEVFILTTGEAVRVLDLARKLILRAGMTVRMPGDSQGDVEIRFTKLKSGEKLREELFDTPVLSPTQYPYIARIGGIQQESKAVTQLIVNLEKACLDLRVDTAIEILKDLMHFGNQASASSCPAVC